MKTYLFLFLSLFCSSSWSHSLEGKVISAEFGAPNELLAPTLCVTVLEELNSGKLLGIVEDIYDCFYTRKAKRNPELLLQVNARDLTSLEGVLLDHLQKSYPSLEFYFSAGE